nr:MAG TPA: hypothetical protein [Caudoviricetes sp.]
MQISFTRSTLFIEHPPVFREKPKNRLDKLENTRYNELVI